MTPTAPRFLSPSSRRLWRAIWRDATADRREDPAWLAWVTAYCEASDRIDAAAAIIRAEGITQRDRRGILRRHPALKLMASANCDLLRAHTLARLGERCRLDRRRKRLA